MENKEQADLAALQARRQELIDKISQLTATGQLHEFSHDEQMAEFGAWQLELEEIEKKLGNK